jgi:hypothetical protein
MGWTTDAPQQPGFYWYRHRGVNAPEPVKVTADGHVLFIGDWRSHTLLALSGGLWGEPVLVTECDKEGR